jgi:4-amino-4-deoxy-L-arabinose transferase-like glycosyltransferase
MVPFETAVPKWFARISKALWRGIVCALVFLLLGWVFVDYAGVQTDEALFAGSLFRSWRFFSVALGHYNLPLMNMPYNGALKLWLYAPVFRLWQPTAGSIRVPAILLGAATIVIFWDLLNRVHSRAAAWAGSILLATDTSFLLCTTYDWGPVALQHLLLVTAMLFTVRWFQTSSNASLVAAALCCGLALWDKAVFVWIFTGILLGSLVFGAEVRRRLTWRCTAIGTAALCMGALPLIIYNLAGHKRFSATEISAHTQTRQLLVRTTPWICSISHWQSASMCLSLGSSSASSKSVPILAVSVQRLFSEPQASSRHFLDRLGGGGCCRSEVGTQLRFVPHFRVPRGNRGKSESLAWQS